MPDEIEFPPEETSEDAVESIEVEHVELEESTVEPEARVEARGDFAEAEAIEGAIVESLEANAPATEEWSTSGDADDRPTEEVVKVEGATAPPTEEVAEVTRISGDADDRPTEEVVLDLEGESKDDPHADEMMDFKPIPAEELDDIALDPSVDSLEGRVEQVPLSRVSKIDEFTGKLDVAEDEVGDFRVPSKHPTEIEPLPSRYPGGDPLETLGSTSDLEITQTEERPPFDPDARPTLATGDQKRNDVPSSTDEGSTTTGEARAGVEDWSTSGDADDRPTEEILAGLEGESKDDPHADEMMDFKHIPAEELDSSPGREMLGFVDELEGGIAKAEVATHDLGPEDVERKIKTQLAGEGESQRPSMDFKHIPAEELDEGLLDRKRPGMPVEGEAEHVDHWSSEVALDRKGGDKPVGDEMGAEIALDRKGDDKPVGDEMGAEIALDRKGDDKPIPDEGGDEVALDRKGDDGPALDGKQGDLTPDQKVLDSDPGAEVGKISGPNPKGDRVSDIEASGPDFKVEIDPEEPDFKFLKNEPGAEVASGFRDKFEGLDNSSGYENLEPILGRLVTDKAFRQQLARDPHSVLGEYELSEEEIHLINQMPRDQLEQMAAEVQARFADTADAAIQEAQANLLAELLWGSEKDKFDTGSATHKDSWKGE